MSNSPTANDPLRKEALSRDELFPALKNVLSIFYWDRPELALPLAEYVMDGSCPEILEEIKDYQPRGEYLARLQKLGEAGRSSDIFRLNAGNVPGFLVRAGEVGFLLHGKWEKFRELAARPPGEEWLGGLLMIMSELEEKMRPSNLTREYRLPLAALLEAGASKGWDGPTLFKRILAIEDRSAKYYLFHRVPELWTELRRSRELQEYALFQGPVTLREPNMDLLMSHAAPELYEHCADLLARVALESGKKRFTRMGHYYKKAPDAMRAATEEIVRKGKPSERLKAVQLLIEHFPLDPRTREFFQEQVPHQAKAVLEEMQRFLMLAETSAEEAEPELALPPLAPLPETHPLPAEVGKILRELLQDYDDTSEARYQEGVAKFEQGLQKWRPNPVTKLAHLADKYLEMLQNHAPPRGGAPRYDLILPYAEGPLQPRLDKLVEHPAMTLFHAMRWSTLIRGHDAHTEGMFRGDKLLALWAASHDQPVPLRELGQICGALSFNANGPGYDYLLKHTRGKTFVLEQDMALIWPYFMEYPETLIEALGLEEKPSYFAEKLDDASRETAYRLLDQMPTIPQKLAVRLWDLALAGTGKDVHDARRMLDRVPDKIPLLLQGLRSLDAERRAGAAEWLGRIKATEAIPPLRQALAAEREEATRAVILEALHRLGVPLAELVSEAALVKEATAGMKKGLPKEVAWLASLQLPEVRWEAGGGTAPQVFIEWLITHSVKVKSSEPTAFLRVYTRFLEEADLSKLGDFLLRAWIGQDTIPKHDSQQAADLARQATDDKIKELQRWGLDLDKDFNEPAYYKAALRRFLEECGGSAINSRGLLALCAAAGAREAADLAHAYVRKWYGRRAPQCKALLAMLAALGDRTSIQVLLAIGNRLRTKGIQEEAAALTERLAWESGWTLEELADRTIPTGGFGEDGRLELDFGPRQFEAALTESLEIELRDATGKVLKSLPEPAKSDVAEIAAESKKALAEAKKTLSAVVKLQAERLYDALCFQRSWRFADWQDFLLAHPIVGQLCRRLVWRVAATGQTFRPLPEGSLTDLDDAPVEVAPEAEIALAHELHAGTAWLPHLKDYGVKPLFPQFGRGAYVLPESAAGGAALKDFVGHILPFQVLRKFTTAHGYQRGPVENEEFFLYTRDLASGSLRVELEFSGNLMPEKNIKVALVEMRFLSMPTRRGRQDVFDGGQALRLGDVPPVLLSEHWADLKELAALGSGFDPDWLEKTDPYA
jgi:hypothetical protein